jgi:hypothetical protein
MSTLTNDAIDKLWDEAMERDDKTIIMLISEIDALKTTIGTLSKRRAFLKRDYKFKNERTRKKSFHRGQTYMRQKVTAALEKAGMHEAAALASSTHVDYDIEPVGRYTGP